MAIFFLFFAATAGSQTNDWDFNDSHCHLTYNIQVAGQADFSAIRSFVFFSSLFQFLFFRFFLLCLRLPQLSAILQCRCDSGQEKASAETRGWGRLRFHS